MAAETHNEADRRRNAGMNTPHVENQNPADEGERYVHQHRTGPFGGPERKEQQYKNNPDRNRQNHGKPLLRPLQIFNLSAPIHAVSRRQFYLFIECLPRFRDAAALVAAKYRRAFKATNFSKDFGMDVVLYIYI